MVEVLEPLDLSAVHVVLPRAVGNSWYDAKAVDPLTEATRAQLSAALDQLDRDVAATGAEPSRLVVGGFSQGACLSAEWAMRGGKAAALVLLTGCRVGHETDQRPTARLDRVPVYASNGDADPWIPLTNFHQMATTLAEAGARLRTDIFPGRPHGVAEIELAAMAQILDAVGDEISPW